MKFVKGVSLFFVCPMLLLGVGFCAGICFMQFFYPGDRVQRLYHYEYEAESNPMAVAEESVSKEEAVQDIDSVQAKQPVEVSQASETLSVETEYVLEERDMNGDSTVETTWRLPDKYVGMNREQFLEAMELYEAFPPLSEMERGFVSLEVLSFSRERVVVQMNYRYVQPGKSFFVAVYDNEVVVYLEDMETVYIETEILLEELPEELQQEIIEVLWIESEEELYDFLETYSS